MELDNRINVNGWTFKLNDTKEFYECRGDVCYDDEHDEIPEPSLWRAALELERILVKDHKLSADAEFSEKGWVEVMIYNK